MRDFPLNQQNFDAVAQLAPLYNAANTNLHAYQQRGGKLILWHGRPMTPSVRPFLSPIIAA